MDSSRISLRSYRSTDADDLLSWAADDRVTRSIHFTTLNSQEEALGFIHKSSIPWRRSICIDDRSIGIVIARPGSGDDRCRAEVDMDSSRISLRSYRSTDVDDLLSWAADDRVTRCIHFTTLNSKEEALGFIHKSSIPWRRSICIDDRSIGIVIARPGSGDDRCRVEVGYALAVEYWGQGITPEALKKAIPLILGEFPEIVRLQALADAQNKASHRVLEKAGFVKEGMFRKYFYFKGEIKDVVIYSFLSTDSIPS